ncbi:hypothetical protein X975_18470, partial [Stegodyphus mimosarum]
MQQCMWFQHDCTPVHFSHTAPPPHLDDTLKMQWIGIGAIILWPPRSPDLLPNDFIFGSYMKSLVYEMLGESAIDLVAHTITAK